MKVLVEIETTDHGDLARQCRYEECEGKVVHPRRYQDYLGFDLCTYYGSGTQVFDYSKLLAKPYHPGRKRCIHEGCKSGAGNG
mmetsp:Transcript_32028/g.51048  ORF Transcript_32028/g.51048 Transcript_32028/m.51048 type:complete len:83 (+) Transcript_32028:294-542(+)